MELREERPNEKGERYLRVLQTLKSGPKTSLEVCKEAGFDDPFKCSSALAVLIRRGAVVHGYALTDIGRRKLDEKTSLPDESLPPKMLEPTTPEPPMPSTRLLPPGFEWMWDGRQWAKRRKPEFRPRSEPIDLFG